MLHRAGEAPDGAHGHHSHLLKDTLPFAAPASAATAGSPWAWGDNRWGQLGDGTTTDRLTPVQVSGLTGAIAIAASRYISLAVKSDGTVWAWGANFYGQLGDGTTTDMLTPVQVSGLTGVTAIAAGILHSLAVSITVTPVNDPPVLGPITASVELIQVNTAISASASFTDLDVGDTHTAVWEWGDGSGQYGTIDGTNVTGYHAYTLAGVYTLTLTVTDSAGASAQSVFQYVVIYDPSAGFVTGGGWINSPAGAYSADPSLAGKATFGFVSKYQKGATTPTGQTEFQFKVASLNFHSSSYDWLVVAGARAQFKGSGTVNGTGDYGFMLTAIDGQIKWGRRG